MIGPSGIGICVTATGLVLARSMARAREERLLLRLGADATRSETFRFSGRRWDRWAARAARKGWPGQPLTYLLALAACAAGAGLLGFRLAGLVGSVAGFVGGPLGLEALLNRRMRLASERVEEQLRELVLALAAGIRAGLSIRRALEEAARDAEPPLREELDGVIHELEVGGALDSAIEGLAGRLDFRDARLLVAVLGIHRRSGGDLPALLDEVADIVAQRIEGRRRARALTAQGRASGVVLAVLPVAFVALLSGTSADGLGAFYRTGLGASLLVAGLICEALGFAWIRSIVRSSEEGR